MKSNMLLPFALIASAKKSRRKRLTEAMIPAMIPVPAGQHVIVSSVMADSQVRREERRVNSLNTQHAEYKKAVANELGTLIKKLEITEEKLKNIDIPRIKELVKKHQIEHFDVKLIDG